MTDKRTSMAGEEWYDRFLEELQLHIYYQHDDQAYVATKDDILKSAKKAAGIK